MVVMEKIIPAMMDLIAYEVCGKKINKSQYTLTDEELAKLYKLSKSHDLVHLVGDALIKNALIGDGEIKAKFQKQIMLAVYRYEKINYELGRLRKVLNEAQIPFIPLKGSVLRRYYPEPWMRTSCDIDVLVNESDLERAVSALTSATGYKVDSKGSHDVGMFSDGGVHLELHYSLIEDKIVGSVADILQSAWKNVSPVSDTSEYVFGDDMFFFYHTAHMAKHFINGGCGIRPFIDIWVLNHLISFNREKRDELIAEGGLITFAKQAEALSEAWFGNGEHTDITRRMQDYLLKGGVYGTTANRVSVQQIRKGGKLRYAFSRIWLPYDVLKFHYPSLEGKQWLLPIFEVRRWFKLIFCGGVKRSVNELKLNSSTTSEVQTETKEMLHQLRIDY